MYRGIFYCIIASVLWGAGGVAGQYLFENYNLDAMWLVFVRQTSAGIGFLAYTYWILKEDMLKPFREDWKDLMVFSVIGLLLAQLGYYYGVKLSNAATTTVILYTEPIYVILWMSYKLKEWPRINELLCMLLAFVGIFLITTHGSFESLAITPMAFAMAMLSAVSYAVYSVQPMGLLKKYPNTLVLGWANIISGISLLTVVSPFNYPKTWDTQASLVMFYLIVGATLLTFFLYTKGLVIIGSTRASLLSCAEPLSSIIFMVALLGTPLEAMDLLGMGLIIAAVLLIVCVKK